MSFSGNTHEHEHVMRKYSLYNFMLEVGYLNDIAGVQLVLDTA